jgi:hypothetical protein
LSKSPITTHEVFDLHREILDGFHIGQDVDRNEMSNRSSIWSIRFITCSESSPRSPNRSVSSPIATRLRQRGELGADLRHDLRIVKARTVMASMVTACRTPRKPSSARRPHASHGEREVVTIHNQSDVISRTLPGVSIGS